MYYFDEQTKEVLDNLEVIRDMRREHGLCLSFDCYNALFPAEGKKVTCKLGHKMSTSESMKIDLVMAGRLGSNCRYCKDYTD